jgi:hypothetical protein
LGIEKGGSKGDFPAVIRMDSRMLEYMARRIESLRWQQTKTKVTERRKFTIFKSNRADYSVVFS